MWGPGLNAQAEWDWYLVGKLSVDRHTLRPTPYCSTPQFIARENSTNALTNIDFLGNVREIVGTLTISNCDELTNINGLWNLRTLTGSPRLSLNIQGNDKLTDLKALEGLERINDGPVSITRNDDMCYADLMNWGAIHAKVRCGV